MDKHDKPLVVLGMLGSTLDRGRKESRWERWRPTVDLARHEDLPIARMELLHHPQHRQLAELVGDDVRGVSPHTKVVLHPVAISDPWDFEQVYQALYDIAQSYPFRPERERYLIHVTTGSHVIQICLFLLTESRHLPGCLVQASPPPRSERGGGGSYAVIDLDLSRYDALARRFRAEHQEGLAFLKAGIETRNAAFNQLIERIEYVAGISRAPLLLTGPTGAGKSQLARRIYELKKRRRLVTGPLVEVNCATLRGDAAMSALFGHRKGAFTGAVRDRPGLLRGADTGILFLDEVGELGLDEQAMLLRALEERRFLPVGADREEESSFGLIAGTNRDLRALVAAGRFREDLLARIELWAFQLPSLKDRPEDVEPNLEFELDAVGQELGHRVSFNRAARQRFLAFATGPQGSWPTNFRGFHAAVLRMGTLAPGGRITPAEVEEEIARLQGAWTQESPGSAALQPGRWSDLDLFDRVQLEEVLRVCQNASSLSDAGRQLFAVSRSYKKTPNDADRLRKYLAKFGLSWREVKAIEGQ